MEQRQYLHWIPISIRRPDNGKLVAVRMMLEHGGDIHYAIGWYSDEQHRWVLTANPKPEAALQAIGWIPLPD